MSTKADVDIAVEYAKTAFQSWSNVTVKERAKIMFRLQQLIEKNADEIADFIVMEGGKTKAEALAEVAKANETVEWACRYFFFSSIYHINGNHILPFFYVFNLFIINYSTTYSIPQVMTSGIQEVSRGVTCKEVQEPLGVVACIVPFNFPIMVPFWTIPIALVCGNCVILKPSEKVPLTMNRVVNMFKEAGVPDGVFQIINGTAAAVNAICEHPTVSAVSFVGSSKVAEIVANKCRSLNKRVLVYTNIFTYINICFSL